MTDTITYLSQFKEDTPAWLVNYKPGDPSCQISFSDIMSGRVGYYPGSGFDGTLAKAGNKSNSVHSFLYLDYGLRKSELTSHLRKPKSVNGYHIIGHIDWTEKDLLPNGQYPLNIRKRPRFSLDPNWFRPEGEQPYCFTEIFERNPGKTDAWGDERFAITFLFADGIDTYYQLFCRQYNKAPWLFLLKDHGFGGNYDCFGRGGLLDAIITKNPIRPAYVLCADNTFIWNGYQQINDLTPVISDTDRCPLLLYQNNC